MAARELGRYDDKAERWGHFCTCRSGGGTRVDSTTVGSRNHEFWIKLAEIGLLKEDDPIPRKELADIRIFSVVQDGVARLEKLLESYRNRLIFAKMNHFFATECELFAVKAVERVKSAGGATPEIIMLMGL